MDQAQEEEIMVETFDDIMHPRTRERHDVAFPHAPRDWSRADAERMATQEGVKLQEDHWDAVRALQEYFSRHEPGDVNLRDLHDALEERFHHKGGMRYLYTLFPRGPVAQGCRWAGLEAPPNATDPGFGSVS